MSYDTYLFKKVEGKTMSESVEEIVESDIPDISNSDTFLKQKERIKKAVTEINKKIEVTDYEASLELTDLDFSIQMVVYPHYIEVHVSYGQEQEKEQAMIERLDSYLLVLNDITGYSIYDPQTDEELNIGTKDEVTPDVVKQKTHSIEVFMIGLGLSVVIFIIRLVFVPLKDTPSLAHSLAVWLNRSAIIVGIGSLIALVRYKHLTPFEVQLFSRWKWWIGALIVLAVVTLILS